MSLNLSHIKLLQLRRIRGLQSILIKLALVARRPCASHPQEKNLGEKKIFVDIYFKHPPDGPERIDFAFPRCISR